MRRPTSKGYRGADPGRNPFRKALPRRSGAPGTSTRPRPPSYPWAPICTPSSFFFWGFGESCGELGFRSAASHPDLRPDGHLEWIDQPVPPPSDREQPRPRSLEKPGSRFRTLLDPALPPLEPRRRRVHVRRERAPRPVLARVLQDVDEGVAHRARSRELQRVVALHEDPANSPPRPVQSPRDSRREPVHGVRERALVARLDERVDVRLLERVLDDPEVLAPARGDGGADQRVRVPRSQRAQSVAQLHRHEHREARRESRALRVRDSCALSGGLAPRAAPLAAPADEPKLFLADLLLHADKEPRSPESFAPLRFFRALFD